MEQVLGGIIIGLAVSVMLLFNGKVTGISGIISGLIKTKTSDKNWRLFFLVGLVLGGFMLNYIHPSSFTLISNASSYDYVIAGFLVGFGTLLGNGCTSGHGVCGISRLSVRSLIATITFIGFGALSVVLFRILRGEL